MLTWVAENCRDVSSDVWLADGAGYGDGFADLTRGSLYDCAGS